MLTSLRTDGAFDVAGDLGLSSLMDTWIKLLDVEANGERTRTLYVIKSRGMSHSNQVREFSMSAKGVSLIDAYIGPSGVLTGTARLVQEAQEEAALLRRRQDAERRHRAIIRRREAIERQICDLQASLDAEEDEVRILGVEDERLESTIDAERRNIADRRGAAE